jgi:hypothetical protein
VYEGYNVYATHVEGTLNQLLEYPIEVIGIGDEWTGYIGKAKSIRDYLYTLSDDEVVVIIDGFDTNINKDFSDIEQTFDTYNCKVLYSDNVKTGLSHVLPPWLQRYIRKKMFGTCKDGHTANAGLYMGYVEYLKIVLGEIIEGDSDDEQRNLNQMCHKFPFLKIDVDNIIFENCTNEDDVQKSRAYFTQIPGKMTQSRFMRSIVEYPKYFYLEIILFILIVYFIKSNT